MMGIKEKSEKKKKVGAGKKSQKLKGKRKVSKTDKEANKQVDKVEGVKVLVDKYGMTNIDALIEYEKFFKKYPSGLINKEQFLEEYKVSFIRLRCYVKKVMSQWLNYPADVREEFLGKIF